ncbi:MAG: Component of the SF3b subcomplex of the U2 snRNP [Alectoria sarmentosa]|nr:MAG: Component of the SF3b subcomplex of the U2 snRNP [Alectoria sarmentosa]
MPPVRSARTRKPPPDGFDDIEDTLLEFANMMKDAENASHEGKKRHEVLWPIFQISHQRSRYVYDLYYDKEAISKQLYEWLLKNGYADGNLIAKWKKQGCVAYDAYRQKRQISMQPASVEYHRRS